MNENERDFKKQLDSFFTPSKPAVSNYTSRDEIDLKFIDALYEPGLQIIVYGSTGVGKSSLIWSTLEKEDLTYLRIPLDTTISDGNFCNKVMAELGFEKISQKTKGAESGTNAEIEAGTTFWQLITFKGKFGANSKSQSSTVAVPYFNDADIDAVVMALHKTNCILFLDDVEKADINLKRIIAHLGKKLSDSSALKETNAKVIYAGVSQEITKLIEVDKSLRDRLAEQLMTTLSKPEIKNIMEYGWHELVFNLSSIDIDGIAEMCCGYPRYAHWIGKQSALTAYRAGRNNIIQSDIDKAIHFIIDKYRDDYQTKFDRATGHKSGLRLRENILYALALSPDIEVHIDYIVRKCSELVELSLVQTQISGPLGELKKVTRGQIVEDGRRPGFHRFSDLMIKPYIRLLMEENRVGQ